MAIDTNKVQTQAADLSATCWAIANDLRGGMDANEFRNYMLGTIFYTIKLLIIASWKSLVS